MFQLTALGAMGEVGRSAFFVDTGTEKIMMDYGTKLREVPPLFPIPIKGYPDAILLSHCHLDHSGGLAIFQAKGNGVPIFAVEVTKPLTELLLNDSVKISREEGVGLPFNATDVDRTIKSFVNTQFNKPFNVKKTEVTYYDAGHIPGSAMINLKIGKKNLFYTGDYQTVDTRLVEGAEKKLPEIDYLITESTYAQRDHPDRETQEKQLVQYVRETLSNDGVCLISGFAVGRLQEVLLVLDKYGIDYPVFMDGMARKATTIINQHKNLLKDEDSLDKALSKVTYVNSERQRKKIIKNPCVVLTTSGMLTGGAIVWYLKKLYQNRNCSLLLTGYQLPDTPGKVLLETGRYISKDLNLEINMFVKRFDFSGHLGRTDLLKFIKKADPEKIFCIHGDNTDEFANELNEKGYDAIAPMANNRTFDLD